MHVWGYFKVLLVEIKYIEHKSSKYDLVVNNLPLIKQERCCEKGSCHSASTQGWLGFRVVSVEDGDWTTWERGLRQEGEQTPEFKRCLHTVPSRSPYGMAVASIENQVFRNAHWPAGPT